MTGEYNISIVRHIANPCAYHSPTATIYIGNPHEIFTVRRRNLDVSPLLSRLLTHHPENGWYVMCPMLSSLNVGDFHPVGQYLERGEYHPNILDEATDFPRLEGTLTVDGRGHEVVRCGTIYSMAHLLELPSLQDLAFRKLKVLVLNPFPALAFLLAVEIIFELARPDMRRFLVEYFAQNYWNLVLAETTKLVDLLKLHDELANGIFKRLSGLSAHQQKVEVKEEARDEAAKGCNIESKEEKRENGDSSQTGQKQATSQSFENSNEKGVGEKSLVQSDFFEAY